jgi:hypothetical protein
MNICRKKPFVDIVGQVEECSVSWVVGGHGALAFLALCKGSFSVSALCALQCAKN